MNLYIDCEFNEFKGELISMAIVSEDGKEWYQVLPCPQPGDWVKDNVLPILGKEPVSKEFMQKSLQTFLMQFDKINLVADWPDDIKHFCETLITGPGMRLDTPPLTMEIIRVDAKSELPHNALFDAIGIKNALIARPNLEE